MNPITRFLLAAIASGATVTYAQTFSSCNPTLRDGCPVDPALGKAVEYDFTKGAPSDFTVSTGAAPVFTNNGAEFTIKAHGQAPTITSKWYMMFGHYEIKLKVSPGQGIVSSIVLQSDDLDEIDWEWLGGKSEEVQTNYFGQGKTTSYTRGQTLPNAGSQADYHTYTLDWTSESTTWAIDGKVIRTLTPATAEVGQYPQSPMQLKIGSWAAGDSSSAQGTIDWAGGLTDYSKGPFTMDVMSVKAIDYSTGNSYSYGDRTGTWGSIKSDGGKVNGKGDPNAKVSTATAAGSSIAQTGGAAATVVPMANGTSNATVTSGALSPSGTATGQVSISPSSEESHIASFVSPSSSVQATSFTIEGVSVAKTGGYAASPAPVSSSSLSVSADASQQPAQITSSTSITSSTGLGGPAPVSVAASTSTSTKPAAYGGLVPAASTQIFVETLHYEATTVVPCNSSSVSTVLTAAITVSSTQFLTFVPQKTTLSSVAAPFPTGNSTASTVRFTPVMSDMCPKYPLPYLSYTSPMSSPPPISPYTSAPPICSPSSIHERRRNARTLPQTHTEHPPHISLDTANHFSRITC